MKQSKARFAVIGDCHFSHTYSYGSRDCKGARARLDALISRLDGENLDFILSLGDLGDGGEAREVPEIMEVFARSSHPVKLVIGNHDLHHRFADEHVALTGMPAPFYDFAYGGVRFIVLDSFEQSRYSRPESDAHRAYDKFRAENPHLCVQEWPGLMSDATYAWLEERLESAKTHGEEVVFFAHVPTWRGTLGGGNMVKICDADRFLALIDRYPNVRAYFAGHYHPGWTAVRGGVLHKTVKSICDNAEPTACIVEVESDEIRVHGIGAESDFVHRYEVESAVISGTAPSGCRIMTNSGEICTVGEDRKFAIEVPAPGVYCLKAVADRCADRYIPNIQAPASEIAIELEPSPERRLHVGTTDGYANLQISDANGPIRWFDIAGTPYGSVEPKPGTWHHHSTNYPTNGEYAFTAVGNPTVTIAPRHRRMRELGWYKGDPHAHLIHGESIYKGNPIESAFIGRAEGYDWLYMAANHANDGYSYDSTALPEKLSDGEYFYRLNHEFPKWKSNHFAAIGCEPSCVSVDYDKMSSLEAAKKYVRDRGGITIPVHPFEGHMSFRQLPIWLNCAPEMLPCIDFFYQDSYAKDFAEKYWFALLNRGYEIGCFATSDAAFDIGRTPGTGRGSTYLKLDRLDEESIIDAIKHRRTSVSWDDCAMVFTIDDSVSGDRICADGRVHTLRVLVFWRDGARGTLRVIRGGEDVACEPIYYNEGNGLFTYSMTISESENTWYTAIVENPEGRIRAAASPIFFRNSDFVSPEVIKLEDGMITPELIAECEKLAPGDLADITLLDRFSAKLKSAKAKLHGDSFSPIRFKSPTSEFHTIFSWVWNGRLSYEQIRRELDDFDAAGIRALYIIPEPKEFRPTSLRTYLEPDYMSDGYLEFYRYAIDYAHSKGMELWLYDEGGWPSGGACGLVAKAMPDCGIRQIVHEKRDFDGIFRAEYPIIAAFDGERRLADGEKFSGELTVYTVRHHFAGLNFVDLTRRDVTDAFIKSTHERYLAAFDGSLDRFSMLFTDEPKLADFAWFDRIDLRFKEKYGYELCDYLPEIVSGAKTESGRRAVIDYKRLLGEVFDESFLRPCADWSHEHGLKFCGHLDHDHTLDGIIAGELGSGLALLRRLDVPGVDAIWRQIFPGDEPVGEGSAFFPRFASSAANQNGSRRALTETFAVYGDDITPDEMRYVINYQLVRGINLINFMNLPYGREKALAVNMRPMLCPEKPGFYAMRGFYDEVARVCYAMTRGERIVDTALYLPVCDISLGGEYARRASESFEALGRSLEARLIDFDMIDDEALLSAEVTPDGLRIGRATYRHIVLPECEYMPQEVRAIAEKRHGEGKPLIDCECPGLRVAARACGEERIYFLFNESTAPIDVAHGLDGVRLDLQSGEIRPLDASLTLVSGEAAIILVGGEYAPKSVALDRIGEISATPMKLRRFVMTSGGVGSCESSAEGMDDFGGISGELSLLLERIDGGEYRLEIDGEGLKFELFEEGRKVGDCRTTPQYIDFAISGGELTLRVSNDSTAELANKRELLESTWDKAEYCSYYDRLSELESPGRTALRVPKLTLYRRK